MVGPHDAESSFLQCGWAGPGCLEHRKALTRRDS